MIAGEVIEQPKTARTIFTEMLSAYQDEHPDLNTTEVAREVAVQFTRDHPGEMEDFFIQEGISILSYTLRSKIARVRGAIYQTIDIRAKNQEESDEEPEEYRPSIFEQIMAWKEFDPAERRTRLLLKFNWNSLDESANRDAKLLTHYGWKTLFKRKLRDGLPNKTITVEEFYTPEQMLALLTEARNELRSVFLNGGIKVRVNVAPRTLDVEPQLALGN